MNTLPKFGSLRGAKLSEAVTGAAQIYRDNPARWTKGVYARNKKGNIALVDKPDAVAFCAEGLVGYLLGFQAGLGFKEMGDVCRHRTHNDGIICFNDGAKEISEVIKYLDQLAADLQAAGL